MFKRCIYSACDEIIVFCVYKYQRRKVRSSTLPDVSNKHFIFIFYPTILLHEFKTAAVSLMNVSE
jgi:hypothetical protein